MSTLVRKQPTLLRKTSLLPGESLSSLLARLATLNFYDPPSILTSLILRPDDQETVRDHLACPMKADTFQRLAVVTKISSITLYAATAHSFSRVITSPGTDFRSIKIENNVQMPQIISPVFTRHIRPERTAQFCPACLAEAVYHRLIWLPVVVSACVQHRCLLLGQCAVCGEPVSISSITHARCGQCHADLTTAEAIPIHIDDLGLHAQRVIQAWLLEGSSPAKMEKALPLAPLNVLYRILDGLRTVVAPVDPQWDYRHQLTSEFTVKERSLGLHPQAMTPNESYSLYATAFKGLVSWPEGFIEFLNAYRSRPGQRIDGPIIEGLGTLYSRWIMRYWNSKEFSFLQSSFRKYILGTGGLWRSIIYSDLYRDDSGLAEEFEYIPISAAARLLGTTTDMVNLLIKTGLLVAYDPEDQPQFKLVKQSEVRELKARWQQAMSLDQVASYLGISSDIVVDLVRVELLTAEYNPSDGFPQWMFTQMAVERCFQIVMAHVSRDLEENIAMPLGGVGLIKAAMMLAVVGLDAAGVLARVATGNLRAYHIFLDHKGFSNLVFLGKDVQACAEAIKVERGWLGRKDLMRLLEVKNTTITRWIKAGLITPVAVKGSVLYFTQKCVDTFLADYITSKQAAKLLKVTTLTIQRWAREGRLKAVCGPDIDRSRAYRFDKAALRQWREERLTFGEAMKLLGVSKATLHRYVVQGRLTPLRDMGAKQRWFARFDVERLIK